MNKLITEQEFMEQSEKIKKLQKTQKWVDIISAIAIFTILMSTCFLILTHT